MVANKIVNIQQVPGYKTLDGLLFEDKVLAQKHAIKLNVLDRIEEMILSDEDCALGFSDDPELLKSLMVVLSDNFEAIQELFINT